jgi:hypothetical protein
MSNAALGDIVYVPSHDPYSGTKFVEAAIVTAVHDESQGEWTNGGTVRSIRSFGLEGVDQMLQVGPADYDDNGVWTTGYALTSDGEEAESLSKAPAEDVTAATPTPGPTAAPVSMADVTNAIAANNDALVSKILAAQNPAPAEPSAVTSPPVDSGEPATTDAPDDVTTSHSL